MIERAEVFFTESIGPIEKTHRSALRAEVRVKQLTRALCERAAESSAMTRHLERGIVRRQAAEAALKRSRKHRLGLLQESARLQRRLRDRTREMLSAQEDERRKTSRQLRDEVAQALLAIHVRLLALKKAVKLNTRNLGIEFAETQQLVKQSVQTMHRLARESNGDDQA